MSGLLSNLREVLEEKEETIKQLNRALLGNQDELASCGIFSPTERKIVGALLAHGKVSFETILVGVYGDNMENASSNSIRQMIYNIRRKLADRGLFNAIELVWGFGYTIRPENAAVVRGWIYNR